jgi:flavorubredoxin
MVSSVHKIETIADGVLVLSDLVAANGRSWLPPGATGFEPFNKYVFVSKDGVLLIDTGVAAHGPALIESLRHIVGSRWIMVVVTRIELDCTSNLGRIVDNFPRVQVATVTKNNPPLGLVHYERDLPFETATRLTYGQRLRDLGFERLRSIAPPVRLLNTTWLHDEVTNTLFTSDFFSADLLAGTDDPIVRKDIAGLPVTQALRRHVLTKFEWLEHAHTGPLRDAWDKLFAEVKPEVLAPGLGRIQSGRDLVARVTDDYRMAVFGSGETDPAA